MTYASSVLRLADKPPRTNMNPLQTRNLATSLSLTDGESRRIDHEGCEAGWDGKKRLWVGRFSGRLVWKCHHCGEKGSAKAEGNRTQVLKRLRPDAAQDPDKITLPYDFDSNFSHWPPEARAWVLKYGIEKPETWGWSESQGRVVIPVWDESERESSDSRLCGYQARKIYPEDPGPKYLTRGRNLVYRAGHSRNAGEVVQDQEHSCVLVEDALSAEKVGRICDSYAMLGTSRFSHADALKFSREYARVIVWFDDDGWQARRAQSQLAARLGLLMPTKIVRTGKDPKEHSLTEIREMVQ